MGSEDASPPEADAELLASEPDGVVAVPDAAADPEPDAAAAPEGQPELLYAAEGFNLSGLAVDDAHIYVTDATGPIGHVVQVPLAGGDALVLADQLNLPLRVTVDDGVVYFLTTDAVMRVPVGGGAVEVISPAENAQFGDVTTDATHVYWSNYTAPGSVRRVPKAGGEAQILSEGDAYPSGLVLADGYVYWAVLSDNVIRHAPADGSGEVEVFAADQNAPRVGLVATETHLYWMTEGDFPMRLMRAPWAGGEPELVLNAPSEASTQVTLVADGTHLYFTLPDCGIARVSLDDAELAVHAVPPEIGCPFSLAADADTLYYTTGRGVYRLAKAGF